MVQANDAADDAARALFFDNSIAEILTLRELADRLKISVSGLRKLVYRDARFPKFKVGQQLRFRWSSVERYLQKGGK